MFESLDLFRTSAAMARHAGQRQAAAAINVANADTPGFRAQGLEPFAASFEAEGMRATRPGHLGAAAPGEGEPRLRDAGGEASPNGNTVSVEAEMLASVEATRQHNQALAVWRHGLTVLRTSLGR